jgi:hypothetical protein
MPLFKVMRDYDHAFDPDHVAVMAAAFDEALNRLGLLRREDAMTLKVAKLIVEFARRGEGDHGRLVEATVAAVRNPTSLSA